MSALRSQTIWWRIDLLALGLVSLAGFLTSFSQGSEETPKEPTAKSLMKQAHDGRAVWTEFPGFTARVRCRADGNSIDGQIIVGRDGKVTLSLPGEDERFAWVQRTLNSVIGHRLAADDAIQNVEFADSLANHPQGRLIRSLDAGEHSLWRVQGDVLTEVHRFSEKSRFVISVTEVSRTSEGKHLPRSYVVTTWETPSEQIQSVRQIQQEWTRVGRFDLPSRHLAITNKSDGSRLSQQIEFLDHQISNATAAK